MTIPQNELEAVQNAPLFLPRYLQKQMSATSPIPAQHLEIIQRWQELMADKTRKHLKGERKLEGDLTTDFFVHILGWQGSTSKNPTLNSQYSISSETRTPDIALGRFANNPAEVVVVGEYKGPKTDLDVKQKGEGYQNRTPVEQARNYASLESSCQFYLVINMREWRLYARNGSPDRYERWFLSDLSEPAHYWRFTSLLSEAAILDGKTLRWLQESEQQDKDITRALYGEYQKMRWDSIVSLAEANPGLTALAIIEPAQTLLDRILFIAFAEDNGLLPANTYKTYAVTNATHSAWDNLKALFRAIDQGSRDRPQTIPAYNGGLFAPNPALESLDVSDELILSFTQLTDYDFAAEVRVTVLGHIFEQSVAELEQLREAAEARPESFIADLAKRIAPIESKGRSVTGKRKENGIVYTPDAITRFIVQRTLGCYLEAQQAGIRRLYETGKGEWRKSAPEGMATGRRVKGQIKDIAIGEYLYWTAWQARLESIKVIDPSCGSGAFLVAAFDVFAPYYRELAQALRRLYPDTLEEFNGDRAILTHNLYGVDINAGAIEIAKLSLWLKTAKRGQKLDSLDGHLLCGNSLRFQPDSKSRWSSEHFGWNSTFKNILAKGGFDVVLGNPPYVRQELIKPYKVMLEAEFTVYDSVADLYAYFYEIGLRLLKAGGCLGYISSSTFFKTGSGEPLRRYLLDQSRIQTVVDFGDLQVFEGVTTYPAIVCLEKGRPEPGHVLQFAVIRNAEQLATLDIVFIQSVADMPQSQLTAASWRLESSVHAALRHKLTHGQKTLKEVYGSPLYGIKTGLNEAFVIDRVTRDKLIAADPKSAELLKPFLEGKDLKKWRVESRSLWLIVCPKGWTRTHSSLSDEIAAQAWMQQHYPTIMDWLAPFETAAKKRGDKGEFWWELRACAYYDAFEKEKLIWCDISSANNFSLYKETIFLANTGYILPTNDLFLLGYLNSSACEWIFKAKSTMISGGYYRYIRQYIDTIPIPTATNEQKQAIVDSAEKCQCATEARYQKQKDLRGIIPSLHPDKRVEKLSTALQNWWQLDFAAFQTQIKKEFKQDIPVEKLIEWKKLLESGAQESNVYRLQSQHMSVS